MHRTLLALSLAAGLGGLMAPAPADAAPASAAHAVHGLAVADRAAMDAAIPAEAAGVETVQYRRYGGYRGYGGYRRYGYRPRYRRYYRRY